MVLLKKYFCINICLIQKKNVTLQAHNETMKNNPINNTNNTNNMKKLSLLLLTVLISVMGWAGADDWKQLNPYAYGLSSSYDPNTQILTISFTLNAPAITDGTYNTTHGVQVYATDGSNDYLLHEVSTSDCQTEGKKTYKIDLSDRKGDTAPCDILPFNTPLTWKVVVWGNKNRTIPKVIYTQVSNNRPNATHGVAIDKNPESPKFGDIYYTEASSADLTTTWDWMEKYTRPCIWQYTPKLTYQGHFYKDKENNVDVSNFVTSSQVEPHRIRISDDNRIFVSSCYTDATTAVWEYKGGNNFNKVITRTGSYGRVLGMDVFGSGNELKILLCYMSGNTLRFREYALGSAGSISSSSSGADKGTYTNSDLVLSTSRVGVSYDDTGDNFWFGIDNGKTDNSGVPTWSSRVIHMTKVNSTWQATHTEKVNNISGGDGIFVKGNLLVKGYYNPNTAGQLKFYTINNDGTLSAKYSNLSESSLAIWSSYWVNDMDMDYAGNLYVASAFAGNAIAIAMPYDGKRTTPAPAGQTFTLAGDPIPNILATDLKYEAVPSKNQYKFSFNVNTKPSKAELRFYTSEADMLANNENVVFSYQFTDLHSGEMSVVFDAVHTTGTYEAGKTLSDTDGNGYLNLPRGEYYWNVYLEAPRNSQVFAPIYTQPTNGNRRLHATIDNNPDNDGFGHIYAVDGVDKKLMVYSIGEAQIDDNDKVNINTNNRYSSLQLLGVDLQNPRRPAVAPDGTVFLADAGTGISVAANGATGFEHAGIWIFDPSNKESEGTAQLTQFHQGSEAVSGISFYGTGDNLTLYKTNTYDEWTNHGDPEGYKDEKWQNNGYRVYDVGNPDGSVKHTLGDNVRYDGTGTLYPFGKGDARGNMSVKATSYGVWFCQHCKDKVSDTKIDGEYAVMLMCYNKQGERIFSSNIADITLEHNNQVSTSLSQDKNSIMQSAPGAGMTISPDEKYLYVVNHDGDILEFEIGGTANAKTLKHTNTFDTEYKAISSLHFDYAGNLVATAFYSTDEHPDSHYDKTPYYSDIVVYTMPNEQENKRHIPAPNSYRFVPERISQDMGIYYMSWVVDEHKKDGVSIPVADVAVYRPLKSTYFNTFCLPFEVDLSTLADNHPYKVGDGGAVLLQFAGASINSVNGEEMLELQFSPTNVMEAGKPYLFKPKNDINTIISLGKQVTFDFVDYGSDDAIASHEVGWQFGDDENKATYLALLPNGLTIDDVENSSRIYLILVDNNRLAQVFTNGSVMGLRGIFYLDHALPAGTGARIVERKSTPTGVIDTQGRPINIDKYLREGRVYIRVGDSLYTITGEKVE